MDKKYDISELKKLMGNESAVLNVNDLENVVGGVEGLTLSPEAMDFAKAFMEALKAAGYTRERLIEEMKINGVNEQYFALYLEVFDSL